MTMRRGCARSATEDERPSSLPEKHTKKKGASITTTITITIMTTIMTMTTTTIMTITPDPMSLET